MGVDFESLPGDSAEIDRESSSAGSDCAPWITTTWAGVRFSSALSATGESNATAGPQSDEDIFLRILPRILSSVAHTF